MPHKKVEIVEANVILQLGAKYSLHTTCDMDECTFTLTLESMLIYNCFVCLFVCNIMQSKGKKRFLGYTNSAIIQKLITKDGIIY